MDGQQVADRMARALGTPYASIAAAVRWGVMFVLACIWHQALFALVFAICAFGQLGTFLIRRRDSKRCYDCGTRMIELSHFACPDVTNVLHARTCGKNLSNDEECTCDEPHDEAK